ncbi:hypothetical protein [Kitasatospora sp. DSM 101779]|nr:hypothetical protein [Kitasatospora sp. DSM 101779]MCU7820107.1 hypothetical protein [Kitasatospora sp. DSM 101779]
MAIVVGDEAHAGLGTGSGEQDVGAEGVAEGLQDLGRRVDAGALDVLDLG